MPFAAAYSVAAAALTAVAFALAESSGTLAGLALACGLIAAPLAFLAFPGPAALASLAGLLAWLALSGDPASAGAAMLLALCMVRLSARRAADRMSSCSWVLWSRGPLPSSPRARAGRW